MTRTMLKEKRLLEQFGAEPVHARSINAQQR